MPKRLEELNEELSEEELNRRARVHNKVNGNYRLLDEDKRQLNIDQGEVKTAGQIFYRPKNMILQILIIF